MDALREAPWLGSMAEVFDSAGGELYLVGGAVRNPLMGLPISDVDVCGPLRPERVCELCQGTAVAARLRAAHFGTVELYVTDEQGKRRMAEYTTFRQDSYRCGHKPDAVRFTTDICVDALRRDFSVNALYRRIRPDGLEDVVDPAGGLAHLKAGVLHTVTPDPDQVLKDDGLRVLRAARFQAELGLSPTEALIDSMTRYAPLLRDIARERLRDELGKTLLADLRYPMLKRDAPATQSGLETLWRTGAWALALDGLDYDGAAVAALSALPQGDSPLALRMALLCRKAAPETIESRMLTLRFSRRQARQAALWAGTLQALLAGRMDRATAVRAGMEAMEAAETLLNALGEAEAAARVQALRKHLTDTRAPLSLKALKVNGSDLLLLCQHYGRSAACIGQTLDRLWEGVLREQYPNERDVLIGAADELIRKA